MDLALRQPHHQAGTTQPQRRGQFDRTARRFGRTTDDIEPKPGGVTSRGTAVENVRIRDAGPSVLDFEPE